MKGDFNPANEHEYHIMSAIMDTRPAQIPIQADRFEYLTQHYKPGATDSRWIMFHHPGHFMIYDNESRHCVFDGAYAMLKDPENQSCDELVAFVYDIRIDQDKLRSVIPDGDEFELFADLICENL